MISNRDRSRLALAARTAQRSINSKYSLGAVLVSSGRVIAASPNRYRNDPAFIEMEKCSEHAEEAVVRLAGKSAVGSTVYVVRVNRRGEHRMARPCQRCAAMLYRAGVTKVVYSGNDGVVVTERVDMYVPS